MSITIDHMTQGDVPAVAALERQCFSTPWSEQVLAAELQNKRARFFAAHEDGRLLGYAGMHAVLDEGYIANIAVDNACRRKGVATLLLNRLVEEALERRLGFLTLEVRESNAPAISFYKKNEFGLAGRRKNFYSAPAEDALLMTRFFGPKKEDQ